MPNWCDLEVTITGAPEVIAEVLKQGAKGDKLFSFENFAPTPEFEESKDFRKPLQEIASEWAKGREGNFDNWYDWRIGNWGTKWDLDQSELYLESSEGSIRLSGYTAWSPAIEIFETITKLYPVKVDYKYLEEGVGFMGRAIIENGVADDDSWDITSEHYAKAGALLDEEGNVYWEADQEYDLYKLFEETK